MQAARGLGADDVACPVAEHVGLSDVLTEERAERQEDEGEEEERDRRPSRRTRDDDVGAAPEGAAVGRVARGDDSRLRVGRRHDEGDDADEGADDREDEHAIMVVVRLGRSVLRRRGFRGGDSIFDRGDHARIVGQGRGPKRFTDPSGAMTNFSKFQRTLPALPLVVLHLGQLGVQRVPVAPVDLDLVHEREGHAVGRRAELLDLLVPSPAPAP